MKIERKRYVLVEFQGQVPTVQKLVHLLRIQVSKLSGQIGLARSSLHVIDVEGRFAIVRCTHESRTIVEAAIQLLEIPRTVVVIRTVSGTIKKINTLLKSEFVDDEEL